MGARVQSTLVAVGALLGIKFIGRDTKDIVALDANAVNEDLLPRSVG
jgi:hypothetical protein